MGKIVYIKYVGLHDVYLLNPSSGIIRRKSSGRILTKYSKDTVNMWIEKANTNKPWYSWAEK